MHFSIAEEWMLAGISRLRQEIMKATALLRFAIDAGVR